MGYPLLTQDACRHALAVRDLTDPAHGPHAMQVLVAAIEGALRAAWGSDLILHRAHPVVSVGDNYDRLHYPPDGVSRDARYTRYVAADRVLRTQMTALIPDLIRRLAAAPRRDVLLVCPGLVYRRDQIDRLHTGEPHQLDLWRITRGRLGVDNLREMIALVAETALPGCPHRISRTSHPYTIDGLEIHVRNAGEWVEIGECGVASPALLREAGLDPAEYGGLAMGLGLDRLLMLRKDIHDIRLLRSQDPRVASQMLDLSPYRPVSNQPPIRRDLSVAVPADTTPEELGDAIREALGGHAEQLESVRVLSETLYEALPSSAVERMGIAPGQKNLLVRLVIRDPVRTLTSEEANAVRDRVYAAIHRGGRMEWTGRDHGLGDACR